MKLHELLESAHLDALGLLDEQEQRAFEDAFVTASPAVQRQVRAEQARWATTSLDASNAEPPPSLKARVMAKVEEAMRAGRVGSRSGTDSVLRLSSPRRVSPLWRGAAIGFAAAAALSLFTTLYVSSLASQTGAVAQSDAIVGKLSMDFGAAHYRDIVFDARTTHHVFRGVNGSVEGSASIFINPDWKNARLFCDRLPTVAGKVYVIVAVNERNEPVGETLKEFNCEGTLVALSVESVIKPGTRLAIASVERGSKITAENVVLVANIPVV